MVYLVTRERLRGIAPLGRGFRLGMGRLHRVRWGRSLETWVDGELEESRARCVDVHLEECEDCAAEVATLLRMKASIREARGGEGVADAVSRLMAEAQRLSPQ